MEDTEQPLWSCVQYESEDEVRDSKQSMFGIIPGAMYGKDPVRPVSLNIPPFVLNFGLKFFARPKSNTLTSPI